MTSKPDESLETEIVVAICVATFKRPKGLEMLINSLSALEIEDISPHLIVVDNDPHGSGEEAFQRSIKNLHFRSSYLIESARGIVSVRNRLVSEAKKIGSHYVVFADDDQTVDSRWLVEIVAAAETFPAAAVSPNLQYQFPVGTSSAIQRCFLRPRKATPTGTPVSYLATNGSLFRMSVLDLVEGPFDMRLNLSGGEDSFLSASLRSRGEVLIACSTSLITEHMPESRLNFGWVAKRAWREGNSRAQVAKWVEPGRKRSAKWCVLFAGYVVKNLLMAIPDAITYRELPLLRFRRVIFGISGLWHMIFGLSRYEEYATVIHGQ